MTLGVDAEIGSFEQNAVTFEYVPSSALFVLLSCGHDGQGCERLVTMLLNGIFGRTDKVRSMLSNIDERIVAHVCADRTMDWLFAKEGCYRFALMQVVMLIGEGIPSPIEHTAFLILPYAFKTSRWRQ